MIVFHVFTGEFLFVLVDVVNVTFFSKKGLEIVGCLDLLFMSEENSMRIGEEWVGFSEMGILSGKGGLCGVLFEEILGGCFYEILGNLL